MFLKGLLLVMKVLATKAIYLSTPPPFTTKITSRRKLPSRPRNSKTIFSQMEEGIIILRSAEKSASIARASNSRPTIFMGNRKMDTALCHEKAAAENQSGFSFFLTAKTRRDGCHFAPSPPFPPETTSRKLFSSFKNGRKGIEQIWPSHLSCFCLLLLLSLLFPLL